MQRGKAGRRIRRNQVGQVGGRLCHRVYHTYGIGLIHLSSLHYRAHRALVYHERIMLPFSAPAFVRSGRRVSRTVHQLSNKNSLWARHRIGCTLTCRTACSPVAFYQWALKFGFLTLLRRSRPIQPPLLEQLRHHQRQPRRPTRQLALHSRTQYQLM